MIYIDRCVCVFFVYDYKNSLLLTKRNYLLNNNKAFNTIFYWNLVMNYDVKRSKLISLIIFDLYVLLFLNPLEDCFTLQTKTVFGENHEKNFTSREYGQFFWACNINVKMVKDIKKMHKTFVCCYEYFGKILRYYYKIFQKNWTYWEIEI